MNTHRPASPPDDAGRPARDLFLPLRFAITLALIAIVVLTLAQIFCRFLLDAPLIWSEELARILIVWMTFIGAAVVCWDGRHLNIDVGFGALPLVAKNIVRIINAALSVGFCILLISPTLRLVKIENFSETRRAGTAVRHHSPAGRDRRRADGGRDRAAPRLPPPPHRPRPRELPEGRNVTRTAANMQSARP